MVAAAAVAAFTWGMAEYIEKGKPSVLGFCSGAVAGLVVITPACGFVLPGSAVIIGVLAGLIPFIACTRCLTIASPNPVPPISRERALSTR